MGGCDIGCQVALSHGHIFFFLFGSREEDDLVDCRRPDECESLCALRALRVPGATSPQSSNLVRGETQEARATKKKSLDRQGIYLPFIRVCTWSRDRRPTRRDGGCEDPGESSTPRRRSGRTSTGPDRTGRGPAVLRSVIRKRRDESLVQCSDPEQQQQQQRHNKQGETRAARRQDKTAM